MRFWLEVGAFPPVREHATDAGIDLRTPHALTVEAHGSARVDTMVHVSLPSGCCGMLVSKSGLNVNHGITSTGLIDEGYTGSIVAKLYNHSDEPYSFKAGDKVTQLVVVPVRYDSIELVGKGVFYCPDSAARGDDGFGSTDYQTTVRLYNV